MDRGADFGFCSFIWERSSDVGGDDSFMAINAGADVMVRLVVLWT
jgi:hypothetical protein